MTASPTSDRLDFSREEAEPFKGLRFKSGKFEGSSMLTVAAIHPTYLTWCWENTVRGMGIPPALYSLVTAKLKEKKDAKRRPVEWATAGEEVSAAAWARAYRPPIEEEFAPVPEEPSFLDGTMAETEQGGFLEGIL